MPEEAEPLKFEKLKLPSHGTMGAVAFQASDRQAADSGERLVLFGGQRRGLTNEMWVLETNGDGFMQVQPTDGPPAPERTQATIVSIGTEPQSAVLIFGGYVINVGAQNDLWKGTMGVDELASPTCAFQAVEADGTPPCARYGHSATVVGDKMVVVGGQDEHRQYSDVWTLTTEGAHVWAQLTPTGPAPAVRSRHTATLVSEGVLLVLGGFSRADRALADAHVLKLAADGAAATWEPLELDTNGAVFAPRAQHAAAVTADRGHVYVFGGYGGEKNLSDLWLIDWGERKAVELRCSVKPEARARHSMAVLSVENAPLLFVLGGHDGMKCHASEVYTLSTEDSRGYFAAAWAEQAEKEAEARKKAETEVPKADED